MVILIVEEVKILPKNNNLATFTLLSKLRCLLIINNLLMKRLLLSVFVITTFVGLTSIKSSSSDPTEVFGGATRFVNYKIFGKKYAKTPIYNSKLKGHAYYIVSGHGGPDPGAMTKKGNVWISEDEYAYDVSLRLARNLIGHGATVYMITRDENDGIRDARILPMDKDETVWGGKSMPLDQKSRLNQRTSIINKLYYANRKKGYKTQRVIVTHIDSRYVGRKVDVFFYHNGNSSNGKMLANTMFNTIKKEYTTHQKGRGYDGVVSSRDLWMLRETKPTTVYIELGNIQNAFDQKRLLISDNRQAIANWLALGVLKGE